MSIKRFSLSWVIIAVTLPLLAMLAWSQFNWLQELQKRDERRIRYSMISSAQTLTRRIHEELLFLPTLLRFQREDDKPLEYHMTERRQFWEKYAINPKILKAVVVSDSFQDDSPIWSYSSPDPFSNEPPFRHAPPDADEIRISVPAPSSSANDTAAVQAEITCVYDRNVFLDTVIPALAEGNLVSLDLHAYRIIDSKSGKLVYQSDSSIPPEAFLVPDVEVALDENTQFPLPPRGQNLLPETLNIDWMEAFAFLKEYTREGGARPPEKRISGALSHLKLQAVLRDGSLSNLSRKATIQNAVLSFGILALILVAMILLAEAYRRSRRLAVSQQEFIATVTHELKTPLAVISSAAQNLTDGLVRDREKAEQYGQLIRKESARLSATIEHFLLYANTSNLTRVNHDIINLSDLIVKVLKFSERDRLELDFQTIVTLPPEPVFVKGDAVALESVVQNLVQNVVRHASGGKYLEIHLSVEERGRKVPERHTILIVRDKGCGIPANEQKYIFEPFWRGKRAKEGQIAGNGIGLNLVKRIVQAHGGTIALESKPYAGSTFSISLPCR